MIQKVVEKALSLVGQGYIYGAKGQTCSPAFRQQQAEQYPEQADKILGTGAKWDGMPVWDCAQLTRAVAKEGGVTLVSGATSQWNKTEWAQKGPIETIPPGKTVFVYRRQNGSDSVMAHTGVALGDGTCVHARGTDYGVIHQTMGQYAWTHWALPVWEEKEEDDPVSLDVIYQARVVAQNGSTVNMREEPGGKVIDKVPLGEVVDVLDESTGWRKILYRSNVGYMQEAFLQRFDPAGMVTITIPREVAADIFNAIAGVL